MSSFMVPAGGGGDPIQEAMGRRGLGGGVTSQVSPGAPTYDSAMQQQIGSAPAPGMPAPQGEAIPMPQGGAIPQGNPEAKLIVGALKSRLETLGKMGQ